MSKIKAILAAAGITSTVIVALLALNVQNLPFASNNDEANPTTEAETTAVDEEYARALEERQAQLDDAKTMMGEREAGYQAQIEAAEQTIADLEATIEEVRAQIAADQESLAQMESEYYNVSGYNWELKQQRDALTAKEAEYAAQIEAANQTILALQAQISQIAGQ